MNDGLEGYFERGATMGVPLLYPWANRLAGFTYEAGGSRVALPSDTTLVDRDHSGLPIHGALPRLLRWDVVDATTTDLTARLEWTRTSPAFDVFPFVHRLEYRAHVSGRTLEIAVTLEPPRRTRSRSRSASTHTCASREARGPTPSSRCPCSAGWCSTAR